MTKDEILKKHEDLNEYHFHDVDRKFILQAMQEYADQQLRLGGVGSSNKVDYKQGFELAQNYISESPCDPDIYKTQLEAWDKYQQFLIDNNIT